jgi:hypothetical protein
LQLELLGDRVVPSVSPHAGYVMHSPQIETIYYGQSWGTNAAPSALVGQLDGFFQNVLNSPYMDMLNEYGVGRGNFIGHDIVSGPTSGTVTDATLQTMLFGEYARGRIGADFFQQPNHLYVVFTDAGVVIQDNQGKRSDTYPGIGGYHGEEDVGFGFQLYYASIANPFGAQNDKVQGLNAFQQMTEEASHELAEGATNPDTVDGWWTYDSKNQITEIGDLANLQYGDENGYMVQYEYSNRANAPVLWTPQAHWMEMGTQSFKKTVTATNYDGRQEVFGLGQDGQVYHMWQQWVNGPWTAWTTLGGSARDITVARNYSTGLEVFAIWTDYSVMTIRENNAPDWNQLWIPLSQAPAALQMDVGTHPDGRLDLYIIGFNHQVYHRWENWTDAAPWNWSAWEGLGGSVNQIAVGREQNGNLEVFGISTNLGQVLERSGSWGGKFDLGWWYMGFGFAQSIAVGTNSDGRLELFAIFADGALWHQWEWAPNGSWSDWYSLGGYSTQIAVTNRADGRLEVLAIGANNAVYAITERFDNLNWNYAWVSLGGYATSLSARFNQGDGAIDVFAVGFDAFNYTSPVYWTQVGTTQID